MKAVRRTDKRMRTLGLAVCAQQRTSPRRLCSAARPFSAARALRAHQECGQRARAGVLRPGSSAEHTAQGCGAPRAHGQQTDPQASARIGGPARRGSARGRVPPPPRGPPSRRTPPRCRCTRAAGAERRRAGRTRAAGPAHAATREGAAACEQRCSEQGYAHTRRCHARMQRARAVKGRRQRRLGSGVDRAQRGKRRLV
jgi:hypothetical protein